jgi:hypothetical protein
MNISKKKAVIFYKLIDFRRSEKNFSSLKKALAQRVMRGVIFALSNKCNMESNVVYVSSSNSNQCLNDPKHCGNKCVFDVQNPYPSLTSIYSHSHTLSLGEKTLTCE